MVSPTYHIIAPVLCSGNTFELAERNSMPSDGAEELLKALHKWYIRRRVCQLQQCNGRLSSKEIEGVVSEIQAFWEHMHLYSYVQNDEDNISNTILARLLFSLFITAPDRRQAAAESHDLRDSWSTAALCSHTFFPFFSRLCSVWAHFHAVDWSLGFQRCALRPDHDKNRNYHQDSFSCFV